MWMDSNSLGKSTNTRPAILKLARRNRPPRFVDPVYPVLPALLDLPPDLWLHGWSLPTDTTKSPRNDADANSVRS